MKTEKLESDIDRMRVRAKDMIKKIGIRKTARLTGRDKGEISKFVNGKRYMRIEDVIEIYEILKGVK